MLTELLSLPPDVLLKILQYVGLQESLFLSCLNREFHQGLSAEQDVWRLWLASIFGDAFVQHLEESDRRWPCKHRLMYELGNTTPQNQVQAWIAIAMQRNNEAKRRRNISAASR
jgi:hypothetical protein